MRYLFIPLLLTVLLGACGYKGPLYLPSQNSHSQAKQEASQSSSIQPKKDTSQP